MGWTDNLPNKWPSNYQMASDSLMKNTPGSTDSRLLNHTLNDTHDVETKRFGFIFIKMSFFEHGLLTL